MAVLEKNDFESALYRFDAAIESRRFGGAIQLSDDPADEALRKEVERLALHAGLTRYTQRDRIELMKVAFQLAMAETVGSPPNPLNKDRMMNVLADVYEAINPEMPYLVHRLGAWEKLRIKLNDDRAYSDMRKQWTYHAPESREEFLQYVMRAHNRAMSDDSLQFKESDILSGVVMSEGMAARYRRDKIEYRDRLATLNFDEAVPILLHENTHSHQDQMARASRLGLLPENSSFFAQGNIYAEFFQPTGDVIFYVKPSVNLRAYSKHVLEREAIEAEDVVRRPHNSIIQGWPLGLFKLSASRHH